MVGLEIPRVNADETISETIRTVDFVAGVARLPRGAEATLRIRAATDPFLVPEVCTLYYRGSEGLRGQVNLRRIGRETDGFQSFMLDGPPLNGLNQDLELTIQGLDDRLADLRIELVEPPVITELQVQARYPAYLRPADAGDSADLVTPYQPGLRLREGSDVELVGQASKALEALDLHVVRGDRVVAPSELQLAAEGKQFVLRLDDLREPTTVVVVPVDQEAIAAQTPHRYFLGVVADAPPEMEIRLRGIGSAITPIARLPVAGTVEDDYRLRAAEVTLAQASGSQPQAASIAVAPDRQGEFTSELDLRDLVAAGRMPPLSAGDTVSVYGEATDDYDLGPPHQTRSEIFRLELVAPEDLLALLERRELALRGRLEQTINETRSLGESLERLLRESFSRDPDPVAVTPQPPRTARDDAEPTERPDPAAELERRAEQVLRLRVQQAGLQARKSGEELTGIANTVADILAEMTHNRIDSVDRRERLEKGVERPLREVVDGPLRELIAQLNELEAVIDTPQRAAARCSLAVEANDAVLLRLTAILEKMLDLESYNEILDMVRDLIENQEALIEDTEKERKQRVLDLFQ